MTRLIDADEFFKNYPELDIEPYNNALTVEVRDNYDIGYAEGHYDGHLEGYTKAINEERPHGMKKRLTMTVPNYRIYEDYHDAVQYARGWNDAMQYIFGKEGEENE